MRALLEQGANPSQKFDAASLIAFDIDNWEKLLLLFKIPLISKRTLF
jgi:hypothetical protein